jgi:hypothetical protein
MEVAAQIYQQMPVLPDSSPESQYVRQLGLKLVATIPQDVSWPFEFHVVPQKEINAFALPGGQMFGGLEGRSTFLRSHSPFPDGEGQLLIERDWLVTVPRNDGSMIFMIFVAPETDFTRLQPAYEAMVKSVQFK